MLEIDMNKFINLPIKKGEKYMKEIYIYSKDNLQIIGIPAVTNLEKFLEDPLRFFPSYNQKTMTFSKVLYNFPILESHIIREKTRLELINEGIEVLNEGEYIENNKIISIGIPGDLYIPKWNEEVNTWEESAALNEIELIIKKQLTGKNKENNAYTVSNFRNLELEAEIKELEKKHSAISMEIVFKEGINE